MDSVFHLCYRVLFGLSFDHHMAYCHDPVRRDELEDVRTRDLPAYIQHDLLAEGPDSETHRLAARHFRTSQLNIGRPLLSTPVENLARLAPPSFPCSCPLCSWRMGFQCCTPRSTRAEQEQTSILFEIFNVYGSQEVRLAPNNSRPQLPHRRPRYHRTSDPQRPLVDIEGRRTHLAPLFSPVGSPWI